MTQKELMRSEIILNLINENINGPEASQQLGLSLRQTKRLKAKIRVGGIEALAHGNRGKPSNRKGDTRMITEARDMLKTTYPDFGPTLACEKLSW